MTDSSSQKGVKETQFYSNYSGSNSERLSDFTAIILVKIQKGYQRQEATAVTEMKTFVALLLVALAAVVLVEADPHRIHGPSQVYNTLPSTYNTAHFPNFRPGFGIFNYPPNQNLNRCKYWCPSYSGYGYTRRYYCCTHIHNQW
ncbi:uncharacterized protein LOC143026648 isoform X2 [Oratosquilla oratoria]|uniref:uncharacterized protein LOC143026648 isoform X2 n=1 Tax=Oratosquilla oratoria TaxID=337810 RepID=UPI003F7710E3